MIRGLEQTLILEEPRLLSTQAGEVDLTIPKLRKVSFYPSILEPLRRIDQALYAV
jgi:transposase-like protein